MVSRVKGKHERWYCSAASPPRKLSPGNSAGPCLRNASRKGYVVDFPTSQVSQMTTSRGGGWQRPPVGGGPGRDEGVRAVAGRGEVMQQLAVQLVAEAEGVHRPQGCSGALCPPMSQSNLGAGAGGGGRSRHPPSLGLPGFPFSPGHPGQPMVLLVHLQHGQVATRRRRQGTDACPVPRRAPGGCTGQHFRPFASL